MPYICRVESNEAETQTTTTMNTASKIRKANPQGTMTMVSGTNDIVFQNGVTFQSETSMQKVTLWNKLIRMGYDYKRASFFGQDELDGLCMAAANGENPFAYSIICSNPSMNCTSK